MSGFSVTEFLVLFGLALLGGLAVLPYSLSLNRDKLSQAKLPLPVLTLLSFVQTAVLMAVAVGVGLLAAGAVGMGAPFIRAALTGQPAPGSFVRLLPVSIGLGVLSFVVMALFEVFVFAPHVPEALRKSDINTKAWTRLLASFYGGMDEEMLTRLFLVSGLAWLLGLFWQKAGGLPADGVVWAAIVLAALLFGLGHLPATRAITPLTPMLVLRAAVLNGVAGIAFGWLYWHYGLEAAMVPHFSADILLHLVGPLFIDRIYRNPGQSAALPG